MDLLLTEFAVSRARLTERVQFLLFSNVLLFMAMVIVLREYLFLAKCELAMFRREETRSSAVHFLITRFFLDMSIVVTGKHETEDLFETLRWR